MTIPFYYAQRHKMTIKGMVISAMFFGCRVSGEKNGIFDERLKLVSTFLPSQRQLPIEKAVIVNIAVIL